jgi:hypothetical protein
MKGRERESYGRRSTALPPNTRISNNSVIEHTMAAVYFLWQWKSVASSKELSNVPRQMRTILVMASLRGKQ